MELCVALDLPTKEDNLALVEKIKDYPVWLKVGFRSYIRDGKEFLKEIKKINPNFKIFLDLKLYDIPNTMADAAEEIALLDVDMFNLHASSGKTGMQTVMNRLSNLKKRPLVLAVTALTSFEDSEFNSIYNASINEKAKQFAKDSYEAGLDGVVCSVYESNLIKESTNNNFLTLTPGIRPDGSDNADQQRVATPKFAKEQGVDFIVVGRPIYKSDNPTEIIKSILSNSDLEQ